MVMNWNRKKGVENVLLTNEIWKSISQECLGHEELADMSTIVCIHYRGYVAILEEYNLLASFSEWADSKYLPKIEGHS